MNWFKALWLTSEEREILKNAKKTKEIVETAISIQNSMNVTQEDIIEPKCYTKLIYSNKNITVVFSDGDYISLSNVDQDKFFMVKNATSKEEIEFILLDKKVVDEEEDTPEEKKMVKDNLDVFRDHEDFIVDNSKVQMRGVNLELPSPVVFSFIEILEKMEILKESGATFGGTDTESEKYQELGEMYNALKTFWLKLALNPIKQSRTDLLTFIKKNDVRITPNGNLVLYRKIVKQGNETNGDVGGDLVAFISQQYYKIKKMKKGPKSYGVYSKLNEYQLLHIDKEPKEGDWEFKGILDELYKNLSTVKENTYVSSHRGKNGQLSIKVGAIYSIPDDEINLDNSICAAGGLHAAAVNYNYGSFGDTPVVVLVNPSKAITVPRGEISKLRTTEMFIACVNDKPHGVHFDDGALSAFDEEYHDLGMQELEEIVKNKEFDKLEIKKNKVVINETSIETIKNILAARVTTLN